MISNDALYALDNDQQLLDEQRRRAAARAAEQTATETGPSGADRAMSAGSGALAGGAALAPLGPWAAAGGAVLGGLFGAANPEKPKAGKSMGDVKSLVDAFGNVKTV